MRWIRSLTASSLLLVAAAACEATPFSSLPEDAFVRWGRTCGNISGCYVQEVEVSSVRIRLVLTSNPSSDPGAQQTQERDINARAWADLRRLAEKSGIGSLADHYGTFVPDVGIEWIEVEASGDVKRVTFDSGNPPPKLAALASNLRALRAEFGTP